jgi:hypothetical protein
VIRIASRRQQRTASAQIERLMRAAQSVKPPRLSTERLESVPAPVARYLRWALPASANIRAVRMTQSGELRTDVQSKRWMAFEAEHIAAPAAVGFVWNARVSVAPLLHVRVRDAFIEGRGSGHVSVLSLFTVAADAGTLEMNSGSLHRFLAEAVWYPAALVPGPNLQWTPIDAATALATLTNHGVSVSLEFRFAGTGEVASIYTPARWGRFGGSYKQAPWEGHFRDYGERDGIFVPSEGDVGWYVAHEWRAVWRGTISAFEVQRAV